MTGPLSGVAVEAATRLRATFDEIERTHRGESGARREDAFREVLRRFLPDRFGVTNGQVVASGGQSSAQLDVIIYDALDTPILDASSSSSLLPIEGVYAVIEIASELTSAKLATDAQRILAVKQFPKVDAAFRPRYGTSIAPAFGIHGELVEHFPVLGYSFGFKGATLPTLQRKLEELDAQSPAVGMKLDGACCLNRGLFMNVERPPRSGGGHLVVAPTETSSRIAYKIDPEEHPGEALLQFLTTLATALSQAWTHPIVLAPYAGG